MRFGLLFLTWSLLMVSTDESFGEEIKPGEQIACSLQLGANGDSQKAATIRYWLFVPADYEKRTNWPLMLFLHGAGERGQDLEQVKAWGPPKRVATEKNFPFVVVSPQCPKGVYWHIEHLAKLVDHIANTCKIDKRHMVVTGLSMGGFGTWRIIARYPKLFAAAAPICGGGDVEDAPKMTQIPIWAFHGDADSTVPVQRTQEMVDAVKQAGGDVKLTIYPGVSHNSWSATYANPKLYTWLLSHTRKP